MDRRPQLHVPRGLVSYRRLVVKVGTTSVATPEGEVRVPLVRSLARQIAAARAEGVEVVLVVSGAIALGARRLGLARPTDMGRLQSLSAIGQVRLVAEIGHAFEREGLVIGQVLLAPRDFGERRQYLHARRSLLGLLALGAVPVLNENDAVASEEIRFGDNDRLAALVAHLVHADLLLLLTDLPGVFDADPRRVSGAKLIETLELQGLDQVGENKEG
jgi:glutamate 5-kinase